MKFKHLLLYIYSSKYQIKSDIFKGYIIIKSDIFKGYIIIKTIVQ